VLNVLSSLSRRGLIREIGLGPSTGGRPPTLVELEPDAHFAIGVNIRPTQVEAVLTDLVGNIRSETSLPLQGGADPDSVSSTVVEAADQVNRLARIDTAKVLGVGVGCPGPVTGGRTVIGIPGFPGWSRIPLAETLERRLGLPVTLENDSNLAALAEFRYGAGSRLHGTGSLVYLYVDHGIGSGMVIDGALYRGVDGAAGEVGHTVIDVDGPPCLCGNYGCLEAVASVGSIVRRTVAASKLGGATGIADRAGGDWESVSFDVVMEAVRGGDPIALNALDEAMAYLAVGINNVCRQLRPDMIVLGGRLFECGETTLAHLKEALTRRPALFGMPQPQPVPGKLGPRASCIGAATLVLEQFFGVAEHAMYVDDAGLAQPAFEETPVWPELAELGMILKPSDARVAWAGNLKPGFLRVGSGDPVSVTVEVELEDGQAAGYDGVKALLHWDRVALFGSVWPSPKNSPMRLISSSDGHNVYGVTLGSLPPGKYEFAAHVLARNDIWVRADDSGTINNGRVEVLPSRAAVFAQGNEHRVESTSRKEEQSGREAKQPVEIQSLDIHLEESIHAA